MVSIGCGIEIESGLTHTLTRRAWIQRGNLGPQLGTCCSRHLGTTDCIADCNWHWGLALAKTNLATNLELVAPVPCRGVGVPSLDLGRGDLVPLGNLRTCIAIADSISVAVTTTVRWKESCPRPAAYRRSGRQRGAHSFRVEGSERFFRDTTLGSQIVACIPSADKNRRAGVRVSVLGPVLKVVVLS